MVRDIQYIFKGKTGKKKKIRLLFCYLKLNFKNHLSKWIDFKNENFLGYKVKVLSYRSFYAMFVDIFIRRTYYFETLIKNPFIIDCGANIGMATLYFKYLYPKAEIICFEPFPSTFKVLEENIKHNNLKSVQLVQAAISANDSKEQILFYDASRISSTGHSLDKDLFTVKSNKRPETITVKNKKLSNYINRPIDLLKLDIEGKEDEVLEEIIRSEKIIEVNQIILEYHNIKDSPRKFSKFLANLESNGFLSSFYQINDNLDIKASEKKNTSFIISAHKKVKQFQVGKERMSLIIDSKAEFSRGKSYNTKEPGTLKWIENNFVPSDVIYDIGANIGQYSLYPAKLLKGSCKIYAFEPEALNFAKLNLNIKENNFSEVIIAYPIALTDKNQLNNFNIQEFGYGEAKNAFGITKDNLDKDFTPVHIQGSIGLTLDSLVNDYGLEQPNHIKIDVDGIEQQVVAGGDKIFASEQLKSVLVETTRYEGWQEREKWFVDFFKQRGLELSDFQESGRITQNLIFKRK